MDVYKYRSYRKLIQQWANSTEKSGARSQLAQAAGCSPSWITRVLNGSVHLTPDQAYAAAKFFGFSEIETDYFLQLVELERCGSPGLQAHIGRKLELLRKESLQLRSSLKVEPTISRESALVYYSSWIYPAAHVLCMIRPFSQLEIGAELSLSPAVVTETVGKLRHMGLLKLQGKNWAAATAKVHLPSDDSLARLAHQSWRLRAAQRLQEPHTDGFHYSAVHCLSREDVATIQRKLKDAVLDCRQVIERSPSETIAVFCLDWFEPKAR